MGVKEEQQQAKSGKHIREMILLVLYVVLSLWSIFYYFWCLNGTGLSMIWLWLCIAAFGAFRSVLLFFEILNRPLIKFPKWFRIIYRGGFAAGLLSFVIVESLVLGAMTGDAQAGLDYVIVLGAQVNSYGPSPTLEQRIRKAAEYMLQNPDTQLIASGGQGGDEPISEAECIRHMLVEEFGISDERIRLEDRSTSTQENMKYSMEIIGNGDAKVGIVTNGFHEFRATLIAKKEGFRNISSVPARTLFPIGIHYTVREFFGVVSFLIRGH